MPALARARVICPAPDCGRDDPQLVGFTMPSKPSDPEYSRYACVCGHEWNVKEAPIDEPRRAR